MSTSYDAQPEYQDWRYDPWELGGPKAHIVSEFQQKRGREAWALAACGAEFRPLAKAGKSDEHIRCWDCTALSRAEVTP